MITLPEIDVLSWMACSKGYDSGFRIEHPLEKAKKYTEFIGHLEQSRSVRSIIKRVARGGAQTWKWWTGTDIYRSLQQGPPLVPPPAADSPHQWKRRGTSFDGYYELSGLDDDVAFKFHLPYIHDLPFGQEVVYFDLRTGGLDDERWKHLIMLASIHQQAYYNMTGEVLYTRYVHIRNHIERRMNPPSIGLSEIVTMMNLSSVVHYPQPGLHCQQKADTGGFRCPLKENGQCPGLQG